MEVKRVRCHVVAGREGGGERRGGRGGGADEGAP